MTEFYPDYDHLPLFRQSDPETSSEAAVALVAEGHLGRMMRIARDLVADHPGLTAKELEQLAGFTDGEIRKRLNDCRRAGWLTTGSPRRCSVTGRRAQTWWIRKARP